MANFIEVMVMAEKIGYPPKKIDLDEQLFMISDPEEGIQNMIIDCEESIVVLEQPVIMVGPYIDFEKLLMLNRHMSHGAFCLDDDAEWVLWRDTLELANLQLEELSLSIHALTVVIAEHHSELLEMSR